MFFLLLKHLTPHLPHMADEFTPQKENNNYQNGIFSMLRHQIGEFIYTHIDEFHIPSYSTSGKPFHLCFRSQSLLHPQKPSFNHYPCTIIFLFIKSFP